MSSYIGSDDVGAVVADVGSYATRIGYAGDDVPLAHFPSTFGLLSSSGKNENNEMKIVDLNTFKDDISVASAVNEDGTIGNWDLFESIWQNTFNNLLKLNTKDSPVLIAEKPYNSPQSRSKMAELMFEKFQTPALFISKDAVLECYAVGRTTGLVIDVGASGTVLAPVCDGWVDSRGLNRSIIGGRCMDSQALAMLKKRLGGANPVPLFRLNKSFHQDRGLSVKMKDKIGAVHPTYDALMVLEIGRDLKESSCRIADSQFQDGDVRYASMPSQPYELPDGTIIELGKERFQIPELLFDSSPLVKFAPELLLLNLGSSAFFSSDEERTPNIAQDSEATISSTVATSSNGSTLSPSLASPESIQRLAVNTVVRCDTDNHQPLLSNIVIAGGGSCFEGMPERIKVEIEKLVHASAPGFKVRQLSTNVTERALCAWIGGSILASLGSFHEYWLTKKEYEENGATVVDRKCP